MEVHYLMSYRVIPNIGWAHYANYKNPLLRLFYRIQLKDFCNLLHGKLGQGIIFINNQLPTKGKYYGTRL